MLRQFAAMSVVACTSGCGSIATWHYSDATLANFLQARGTHCDTLPRSYSGVMFDYCWLDSEPQQVYGSAPMLLLFGDAVLSAIADTLALPITAVQQREYGNIPLERP